MLHILGSSGYLGSQFLASCKKNGIPNISYSSKSVDNSLLFDLSNANESYLEQINEGDIVYFFPAVSSPDICEHNYEFAYTFNVKNTAFYIDLILKKNARVIFFSSDVVYGNNNYINDEKSNTNPYGNYAIMKSIIENNFLKNKLFFCVRLSYVFSEFDKFFIYLKKCLKNKERAIVYEGLYRNIIYVEDVISSLIILYKQINDLDFNLLNLVGPDNLSRLQMAQVFKQKFCNIDIFGTSTPMDILKSRPDKIFTKSINIDKITKKSFINYFQFIQKLQGEL